MSERNRRERKETKCDESAVLWMGWLCAVKEESFPQHPREKETLINASSFAAQPPASQLARVRLVPLIYNQLNLNACFFFSFIINSSIWKCFFLSLHLLLLLFLGKNSPLYISEQRFFYSLQFFFFFLLKYLFTLSSVQLRLIVSLVNVIPKVNPGSLSAWH